MLRSLVLPATLFVVTSLCGCQGSAKDKSNHTNGAVKTSSPTSRTATREPVSTQPAEFTGTLRGGTVAVGGETTGWRLEGDGATGGIDLDVSKVRDRARPLEGQRVNVTGRMTARSWPERGETQVLVVDRIEPAPPRTRPAGSR
jgi:hypothetical protein